MLTPFHNSAILSKFDGKSSKVNQVIFFSAPIDIPNMKALPEILFETSCTRQAKSDMPFLLFSSPEPKADKVSL